MKEVGDPGCGSGNTIVALGRDEGGRRPLAWQWHQNAVL